MSNTKKNIAWNMLLTGSRYIFPLLTYPYVSRVLGVANIGICNYVDSIINYFVLFAMLGIGSLGVREIARVKDEPEKLKVVFSSLTTILLLLTIISTVILVVLTYEIKFFAPYKEFLLVGIIKLVFSSLTLNWAFQGLSEFRFVTIRTIVINSLYVISVFIFVHNQNDVLLYFFLTCIVVVINALVNWRYIGRWTHFSIKDVHPRIFMAAILSYGFYNILTSMYTSFNVFYLGIVTTDIQVGYYATATKLYTIFMSVFTAVTTVMVPRISELIAKKEASHLNTIAKQTFQLIFIFSFPIIIISFFYADVIVEIISGKGYEGAILPFRIVMILLLVIALEQIIIQQFLMAVKESKCVVILSAVGSVVGVVLNLLLTPSMGAVGSAISWTMAEICILMVSLLYFKKYFCMTLPWDALLRNILVSIPYLIICYVFYSPNLSMSVLWGGLLCTSWFIISNLFIIKNEMLLSMLKIKLIKNNKE